MMTQVFCFQPVKNFLKIRVYAAVCLFVQKNGILGG